MNFKETMESITNIFEFDPNAFEFKELEKYLEALMTNNTKKAGELRMFLYYFTNESAIMRHFVDLYFKSLPILKKGEDVIYIIDNSGDIRAYETIESLATYLHRYHIIVSDPEVFMLRFRVIKPIPLIK
jgi:hypothetical protein